MKKMISSIFVLALLASACPKPPPGPTLQIYNVELREKINTCRELDLQVARETIFIEDLGDRGVLHLGAERTFPVELSGAAITGELVESDHTQVDGHHIVCKRLTRIELSSQEGQLKGTYERQRRQECVMDAKPCTTTWTVSGQLVSPKPGA